MHPRIVVDLQPVLDPAKRAVGGDQGVDLPAIEVASACSAGTSPRARSAGSRPPRISWKAWAMNSISRIPPRPYLTLRLRPLRATSRSSRALRSRSASNAPKSR